MPRETTAREMATTAIPGHWGRRVRPVTKRSVEQSAKSRTAVLWPRADDSRAGKFNFAAPRLLQCRENVIVLRAGAKHSRDSCVKDRLRVPIYRAPRLCAFLELYQFNDCG